MDFSSFLGSKLEGQRKYQEQPQGWDVGRLSGAYKQSLCVQSAQAAGQRLSMQLRGGAQPVPWPTVLPQAALIEIASVYPSRSPFSVADDPALRPLQRNLCQLPEPGEHSTQCQEVMISILSSSWCISSLFLCCFLWEWKRTVPEKLPWSCLEITAHLIASQSCFMVMDIHVSFLRVTTGRLSSPKLGIYNNNCAHTSRNLFGSIIRV